MSERKSVNYSKIVQPSTRIILFGEVTHNSIAYKKEFITALKVLKKLNFTHIALEMFPSNLNEKLKAYSEKGQYEHVLIKHLQEYWDYVPKAKLYVDIMKTAKSLNMQIIGLDMPYEDHEKHQCKERVRTNCQTSSHAARNQYMVDVITSHVNKGAKIVAFMQYWHLRTREAYEPGMKVLLQKNKLSPIFISLVGGPGEPGFPTAIKAAEDNKSDTRFYVKGLGADREDYIIHSAR